MCVALISSSIAELISGLRRIGVRNDRMERGDGGVWRRGTQTEGWKVRLRSEKGRQLVAAAWVKRRCGSLTVNVLKRRHNKEVKKSPLRLFFLDRVTQLKRKSFKLSQQTGGKKRLINNYNDVLFIHRKLFPHDKQSLASSPFFPLLVSPLGQQFWSLNGKQVRGGNPDVLTGHRHHKKSTWTPVCLRRESFSISH